MPIWACNRPNRSTWASWSSSGITKQQAEEFVKKYGISEELLIGKVADDAIAKVPAVVQKQVAREKAQQYLTRQRALTQRGAGTPQELDDAETDLKTAAANFDDAFQSARTVIANAIAVQGRLSQAGQTLIDMTIRAPTPKLIPPSFNRTSVLSYGITKRQVSEGQMIKEGEAIAELVIEDPIRLWSQVPEQYPKTCSSDSGFGSRPGPIPDVAIEGKVARINPSVELAEPNVPGRNPGVQRARSAPARRICQGRDHHRRRGQGGRRAHSIRSSGSRVSPSSSSSKTARHDRSTTSRPEARAADGSRSRASCSPTRRSGRHHRANSARRRNARRDPRARAAGEAALADETDTSPETARAPGAPSRR